MIVIQKFVRKNSSSEKMIVFQDSLNDFKSFVYVYFSFVFEKL